MKIKLFIVISALFFLFGCSKSPNIDINLFCNDFNKASEIIDISAEGSSLKLENNNATHYLKADKNVLLTLSSLPDGTIHRCTVTYNHSGNYDIFLDSIKASIVSFCNEEPENIINKLKLNKNSTDGYSVKVTSDWHTFDIDVSKNTTVFIIRSKKYSPETNTSPTLKNH